MKRNPSAIRASTLLPVHDDPMPLRLPVGSTIFAYRGEVWITQEGMYDDVILAPGERFDVRSRALILASATKDHANIYIAHPKDAGRSWTSGLAGRLAALSTQLRRGFRASSYQPQ